MSTNPEANSSKQKRRRFTAEYKARILQDLEQLEGRGEASALLRAEGLYWSHVAKWRLQRDEGELEDSWTEPWVRARIQSLIQERGELMREIEELESRNGELRERLDLGESTPPSQQAAGPTSGA